MIVCRNDNFTEAVKEAEHLNALCESMLTCPIITHLFKHIEDSDTDAYLIPDYVNKPAEEDDDILSLTSKWGQILSAKTTKNLTVLNVIGKFKVMSTYGIIIMN